MINHDKNQRLYMQVAKNISDYIQQKKLLPGQRLPTERELATMFNVSRASIREALIALELSHWVEIKQGVGILVVNSSPIDATIAPLPDDISPFEILETRLLLEPKIAELATIKANDDDINRLSALLQLMKGALLLPSIELQEKISFESDRLFHNQLATIADNRLLSHMLELLWIEEQKNQLWNKLNQMTRALEKMQYWIEDHNAILEAMKNRDGEQASLLMMAHLSHVKNVLTTIELRNT